MLSKALFTSRSDEWETPQWLFDKLNRRFKFSLDVCATRENAKCKRFFTRKDNGLQQKWTGTCWCNPPYGRQIGLWIEKAYKSSLLGATVVCLVPARTDTRWWHGWAMRGEITFLQGRLMFVGAKHAAPFPSAIITFRRKPLPRNIKNTVEYEKNVWGPDSLATFAPWLLRPQNRHQHKRDLSAAAMG